MTEEEGSAVLIVSYIGYFTCEKNIHFDGKELSPEIVMESDVKEMSAVIISAGAFEASDEAKSVMLKPVDITTTGADADIYHALNTLPGTQKVGESEGLFVCGGFKIRKSYEKESC